MYLESRMSGFYDEFVKISFGMVQAQKVLGVAKRLKLPKGSMRLAELRGGGELIDAANRGMRMSPMAAFPPMRAATKDLAVAKGLQPRILKALEQAQLPAESLRDAEGALSGAHAAAANQIQSVGKSIPQGAILRAKGMTNESGLRGAIASRGGGGELPYLQNPEHKKMLNAIVEGHEMDEMRVPGNWSMKQFGHRSPDVILREHNRVATLPAGHEPVRKFMQGARSDYEGQMLSPFGIQYGQGPRLSRHARRHISNRLGQMADSALPQV